MHTIPCLHVPTGVGPWNCSTLQALDACLLSHGSVPVPDLPSDWSAAFQLQADGEHFTERGLRDFAHSLARSLRPLRSGLRSGALHILTDSTVDDLNYDPVTRERTGYADSVVQAALEAWIPKVTVDAVCGTGFLAGAPEHFYSRLSAHRRAHATALPTYLFLGGWNDRGKNVPHLLSAAARCVDRCLP